MSWFVYMPLKFLQFLLKLRFLWVFRKIFYNTEKIHIKKSEFDQNILLLLVDLIMEFSALILLKIIGDQIDSLRGDDHRTPE